MGLTERALAQQGDDLHARMLDTLDPVTKKVRVGIDSPGLEGTLGLPGIYNDLTMYEGIRRFDGRNSTMGPSAIKEYGDE